MINNLLFIFFVFYSCVSGGIQIPSFLSSFFSSSSSTPSLTPFTTKLSSSQMTLPLRVDYNKQVVQSNVKQDVLKALVHLKGFPKVSGEKPEPIGAVVVIDRSGSMSGEGKLKFAIEGAHCLVDLLAENDTIGIVVFDDNTKTLFSTDYATKENKIKLHDIISKIRTGGSTNIYDGLKDGIEMLFSPPNGLKDANQPKVKRLILLSDGEANVNTHLDLKGLVSSAHRKGITISSVGLGVDYDERLMQEVAERGGGNYYYVRESKNLPDVFTAELGYGRRTVTHDTQAFLAYDAHIVQAVDIIGHQTHVADKKDVEWIRQLQREMRVKEERESNVSSNGNESASGRGGSKRKWDVLGDDTAGMEILAINVRDFTADEEREMLIYLNYTTTQGGGNYTTAQSRKEKGMEKEKEKKKGDDRTDKTAAEPYDLPLASLILTYRMEERQSSTSATSAPGKAASVPVFSVQGVSTLSLGVCVDDDTGRAVAANSVVEAVEAQRRVGLAVEFAEANRVHLKAMDMVEHGDYAGADILLITHTDTLRSQASRHLADDDADGAEMLHLQEERFEESRKMAQAGKGDRRMHKRMRKASSHFMFTSASGSSSSREQGVGGSREKGKIEL